MSTLPELIRVKRKRDETAVPVDFLELEPKRHRSDTFGDWVYQRRGYAEGDQAPTASSPATQRRFLLSRPAIEASSKRRRKSVVFVECTTKKPRLEIAEGQDHEAGAGEVNPLVAAVAEGGPTDFTSASVATAISGAPTPAEKKPPLPPKRPLPLPQDFGFDENAYQRALAQWNHDEFVRGCVEWEERCRDAKQDEKKAASRKSTSTRQAGDHTPITVPTSKAGSNREGRLSGSAGAVTGASTTKSLRFKPKKPSQRYSERHPESVTDTHPLSKSSAHAPSSSDHPSAKDVLKSGDVDAMDIDGDSDGDSASSGDWVVDVYERVPASKILGKEGTHNVGLIVFEDSKDQQFFYGPEGDSEDEDLGDDDNDSNAEDHYAHEYPEEESGDEDERDPDEALYDYDEDGHVDDDQEFDYLRAEDPDDNYILDGETDAQMLRKLRMYQARRRTEQADDHDHYEED